MTLTGSCGGGFFNQEITAYDSRILFCLWSRVRLLLKEFTFQVTQSCLTRRPNGINHERFSQMLGTEIRKRVDRFHPSHRFLFLAGISLRSVHVALFVDSVIRSLDEALVLLFALQHSDAKRLAVGRHLRDVRSDERNLDDQIDLTRALYSDS